MTERGGPHTIQEWLEQPPERRVELIDREFIDKPPADVPRALVLGGVITTLVPAFRRADGGWRILPSVDIQLGENGYRPDLAAWKRVDVESVPQGRPVRLRPSWICEVLSDHARREDCLRRYHLAGVEHLWLIDPEAGTLNVFRHEPHGYSSVLVADRGQRVRAEPFDAIEVMVSVLLGDDPE